MIANPKAMRKRDVKLKPLGPRLRLPISWKAFLIVSLSLLFSAIPTISWGSMAGKVRKGNRQYDHENYEQALREYRDAQLEDPESSPLHYNIGNALYKQEKWQEAQVEYGGALSSQDNQVVEMTNYNMGNVQYRLGNLQEAIEAYKNALRIDPNDRDAKYNLEFVQQKLQESAQQQSQQQQDQESQEGQQERQEQSEGQEEEQEQQEQSQEKQESREQEKRPQEQQQGQKEEEKEEQEQPPPKPQEPGQMSREEAAQLLNALKEQEKKAQEEHRRAQIQKGSKTEWDW